MEELIAGIPLQRSWGQPGNWLENPVPKLKTVQPSVARCKNPVQEINPEFVKTSFRGLKPEDQKTETANQNRTDIRGEKWGEVGCTMKV